MPGRKAMSSGKMFREIVITFTILTAPIKRILNDKLAPKYLQRLLAWPQIMKKKTM